MELPMGAKNYTDPLGFVPNAQTNDPTKEAFERAAADLFNLNAAFHRCFSSPDGKAVLDFLVKNTLEAGTWLSGLAASNGMDAATAHGFAREGQNALIRDILSRIDLASKALSPDDYINQLQMKGARNG